MDFHSPLDDGSRVGAALAAWISVEEITCFGAFYILTADLNGQYCEVSCAVFNS